MPATVPIMGAGEQRRSYRNFSIMHSIFSPAARCQKLWQKTKSGRRDGGLLKMGWTKPLQPEGGRWGLQQAQCDDHCFLLDRVIPKIGVHRVSQSDLPHHPLLVQSQQPSA